MDDGASGLSLSHLLSVAHYGERQSATEDVVIMTQVGTVHFCFVLFCPGKRCASFMTAGPSVTVIQYNTLVVIYHTWLTSLCLSEQKTWTKVDEGTGVAAAPNY